MTIKRKATPLETYRDMQYWQQDNEWRNITLKKKIACRRFEHFCNSVCVADNTKFIVRMLEKLGAEEFVQFVVACNKRNECLDPILQISNLLMLHMETLHKHDAELAKQLVMNYMKLHPYALQKLEKAFQLNVISTADVINRDQPIKSKILCYLRRASSSCPGERFFNIVTKLRRDEAFPLIRDDVFVLLLNKVELRHCNKDMYKMVIEMLQSGAACSSIAMERILCGMDAEMLGTLFDTVPTCIPFAKEAIMRMAVQNNQFSIPTNNIRCVLGYRPEWINFVCVEQHKDCNPSQPFLLQSFLLREFQNQPELWAEYERHADEITLEVLNKVKSSV